MLASITPLGERGRGTRWGVTVAWFFVGALVAGVVVGGLLGAMGAVIVRAAGTGETSRTLMIAALAVAAGVIDLLPGVTAPTWRRQVNPYWLGRYRGWVVGAGFGFQLGTGVATVVTTATVYATLVIAVIAGSPAAGAAIVGAFGLARSIAVLPAGRVRAPADLMALSGWIDRQAPAAARAAGMAAVAIGSAMFILST